ncbi:heparan-sulfate 6-O-sulfotransferase 1 [Ciona intestinalis]
MNDVLQKFSLKEIQKKAFIWIVLASLIFLFYLSLQVTDIGFSEKPLTNKASSTKKSNTVSSANNVNQLGVVIPSTTLNNIGQHDLSTTKVLPKAKFKTNMSIAADFDINSTDVMVVLHMQKTSGSTFGRHLVRDLEPPFTCEYIQKKMYRCPRPNMQETWLFSRFSKGWKCGVHAGWTSLTECVPLIFHDPELERRYFYVTVLREPVARFLSEWGHVTRAATWDQHKFLCNKVQNPQKVCWGEALDWRNASLEEFINCDINFGRNRQTRMLADLKLVNCSAFGDEEHDRIMLESAKNNLMSMPFFGLAERQVDSQALFEQTFGIKFTKKFVDKSTTHVSDIVLDEEVSDEIKKLNHLDLQLYDYAKGIFAERYERIRKDEQE